MEKPECLYNYHDKNHPERCDFESLLDEYLLPDGKLSPSGIELRNNLIKGTERMNNKVHTFKRLQTKKTRRRMAIIVGIVGAVVGLIEFGISPLAIISAIMFSVMFLIMVER